MLQRPSARVSMYLDRAALSCAEARRATDENTRAFHERQEAAWMSLAASTAFAERVDLFLHTVGRGIPPGDRCRDCHRFMRFASVKATEQEQIYTLRCGNCGATARRVVAWQPVATVPVNRDVELAVIDRDGPHALVFPCRRAVSGWITAGANQPIDIQPTHWRPWCRIGDGHTTNT